MNCKNCHTAITQNYCPNCGQPAALKRINSHYFQHEIEHFFHVERGIFFTAKELMIRPGLRIREFLTENRTKLVKPIIYLIITSLIYAFFGKILHFDIGYITVTGNAKENSIAQINDWVNKNYQYANLIIGLIVGSFVKLFFRKSVYNLSEILIFYCYVIGQGMLVFSLFGIISWATKLEMAFAGIFSTLYGLFAVGQFFEGNKWVNYLKGLAAYLIGIICFAFLVVGVGMAINFITKYK